MLPTTLVTIVSVLLKLSSSSPVYNMQPAYITATIGSTGRNIRNLPCISRKSNQSGVCMFAIDCLKSNGTHLGTCIDRFYFGSCCHVEPIHDIVENTIDTALIPSRQPPNRVTSTTEKITTPLTTITTQNAETTISERIAVNTTTPEPITTVSEVVTTKLSTIARVTESTTHNENKTTTAYVTRKPIITTRVTTKAPDIEEETTNPYKLQTFQSVDGNEVTTLTPFPTTKPPRPLTTKPSKITTTKTSKIPLKPKPTIKPIAQNITVIYKPTRRPITKPTTHRTTRPPITKPTKVTRPIINSTHKQNFTTKPTVKPVRNITKPIKTTTVTRKPVTTTILTTTEIVPTTLETTTPPAKTTIESKVTNFIVTNATTETPTTTTNASTTHVLTTTEKFNKTTEAAVVEETSSPAFEITLQSTTGTFTTESNELPISLNATSVLEAVNGNPATNEIESEKPAKPELPMENTTYPALVTWAQVNDNVTKAPTTAPSSAGPEDWVPITTPDGWVLLPSLSTITEPTSDLTTLKPVSTGTTETPSSVPITDNIATTIDAVISTISSVEPILTNISSSSPLPNATTEWSPSTNISSTTPNNLDENKQTNMSDFTDVCGRRMFPEARIVGGEKSSFGKWPWQISLRQWRTSTYLHKCGAALLNENWAITAAHCVDNVPPSDLLLRLGEHDLSTETEPYLHQERRVQIVASHPQFDPRTFEYDLALLRFYEPVQFQPNILPVCVPQNDENFVGRTAYVTGWGRLYEDGPLPSILQEVSVPVINNTVCESMYRSAGYIEHIPNIFICAGWRRGGFDSCEGDSGGPMVIQRPDKRFLLAGVISWGIGCAEPNQPGVYTRISEFRDWINQILQF